MNNRNCNNDLICKQNKVLKNILKSKLVLNMVLTQRSLLCHMWCHTFHSEKVR